MFFEFCVGLRTADFLFSICHIASIETFFLLVYYELYDIDTLPLIRYTLMAVLTMDVDLTGRGCQFDNVD